MSHFEYVILMLNTSLNQITNWTELTSYFGEAPARPKVILEAWCSSNACNRTHSEYSLGKKKAVSKGAIFCPDCSCALFWTPQGTWKRHKR